MKNITYKIKYSIILTISLIFIALIIYFISIFFHLDFLNYSFIFIGTTLAVLLTILVFLKYEKEAIIFNFIAELELAFKSSKIMFFLKLILFGTAIVIFSFIFAYPYQKYLQKEINKNGIDIVLVLDISTSMNAQDLKPSRLEAAKKIINQFLDKLKNDRIGLVVFAGKPFVSLPLTFDYEIVKETIKNLNTDIINQNYFNGTAIGDALLMGKNLFKATEKNKKRTKIIILLTDGDANKGVNPILAAEYLKKNGIKVYTIGIGSEKGGIIPYKVGPFTQYIKIPPLKEDNLREIASITNGKFFRATDNESLEKIFNEISNLEKTKIKVKENIINQSYTFPFILVNFIILLILSHFRFNET